MPWPRPRRALCFLCVASCESVASSFGVNSVLAAAAGKAAPTRHTAFNLARGGAGSHSSGSSLGTASGGVHDSGGGGGGGGGRKGVSAVQAVAEVQQVAVPEDLAGADVEQRELPGVPPPPPPPPSIEDGEFDWAPRLPRCFR